MRSLFNTFNKINNKRNSKEGETKEKKKVTVTIVVNALTVAMRPVLIFFTVYFAAGYLIVFVVYVNEYKFIYVKTYCLNVLNIYG